MRTNKIIWSIYIFSLVLGACSELPAELVRPDAGEREREPGREMLQENGSLDEFVEALEAAGAEVENVGTIDRQLPFIDVSAHILRVNGADVQVLEFVDESSRQAAETMIQNRAPAIESVLPQWITQANIWSRDRILVLYVGQDPQIIHLISGILGEPIVISNDRAPAGDALQAATQVVQTLSPMEARVNFVSIERREWPDSCLGIPPPPGEACLQVITPGFLITVEIDGQRFTFRSDESGRTVLPE